MTVTPETLDSAARLLWPIVVLLIAAMFLRAAGKAKKSEQTPAPSAKFMATDDDQLNGEITRDFYRMATGEPQNTKSQEPTIE